MGLRQQIKAVALSLAGDIIATDVRIGLGYTGVRLNNGQTGVAATLHYDLARSCTAYNGPRPLAGNRAAALLELFDSRDNLQSAVALATANALFNLRRPEMDTGDILDIMAVNPDDRVGMVGHFAPLIPPLKKRAAALEIFEKVDFPSARIRSHTEIPDRLPACQIAIITATAIINSSIDAILEAATACRKVVLLGASTPLHPAIFDGTPVTGLSGVCIREPDAVLTAISEGGGTPLLKKHVDKVNLQLPVG